MINSHCTNTQSGSIPHTPLPSLRPGTVLFLDFDGVLHRPPYWTEVGLPALDPEIPDHQLFERLHLLEPVIDELPIQVVLSTTWVPTASIWLPSTPPDAFANPHPWGYTLVPLLGRAGKCVVGSTFEIEFGDGWKDMTRFEQIETFAARHQVDEWVALDDDARGWPKLRQHNLVKVDPDAALTKSDAHELRQRLHTLLAVGVPV